MTLPEAPERPTGRLGRVLAPLAWALAGALAATLFVADPFGWRTAAEPAAAHDHASHAVPVTDEAGEQLWTCGMHPEVLMTEPGQCPICGMNLVPVESGASSPAAASGADREPLFYRNPMDPTVTSPVPAKDSMGMDYVPVYAEEAAGAGPRVTIDPVVAQNMNVRTAVVERVDLVREIRTVGYLDYDQERMVTVTTKYPGFVEKVYVNYVGEPVRRGQPLFEIYAPELVQTQEELLSAVAFAERMASAPEEARLRAEALVAAARQRLGYWDIGDEQVARIEASGAVLRTLTVTSPAGGVVMKRAVSLEGMAVTPGMELFHIADLSHLWLSVEVFEDQLAWLREGAVGEIGLSYFPGESFSGKVRFVEPQVSEATRTVGLRLEVPNREGRLRAGMYATVRFAPISALDVVAVPSLAVLRTGERDVVIVALGEGKFEPRRVVLGVEGDDLVHVLSGVEPGERVVTSAQFLIDSESNLREAVQKLLAARAAERGEPPAAASPPADPAHGAGR